MSIHFLERLRRKKKREEAQEPYQPDVLTIPEEFAPDQVWILNHDGTGSPQQPITSEDIQNSEMARYLVKRKRIAQGGMGVVYRAFDLKLGISVAIKFAHQEDTILSNKLRQEVLTMAKIESGCPYIIPVLNFLPDTNLGPAIIMKYMDPERNPNLNALVRTAHPLDFDHITQIMSDVGTAVDYMWRFKILHADLKPSNIIATESGHAKLTDFGLSMSSTSIDPEALGTPAYLSPERVNEQDDIDVRSEVFSLGIISFYLFTGKKLFDADSPGEAMTQVAIRRTDAIVRHEIGIALAQRGLSAETIEQVIAIHNKALEKDRNRRYDSALQFTQALRRALLGFENTHTRQ